MNENIPIYSDLNQSLQTEYIYNVDSIKQSIRNILVTRKGSRVFNSEFGSNIHKYLFEIMDNTTSFALLNEIVTSIERWEPRVKIVPEKSSVVADYQNGIYWVDIAFKIIENPSEIHNLELGFSK